VEQIPGIATNPRLAAALQSGALAFQSRLRNTGSVQHEDSNHFINQSYPKLGGSEKRGQVNLR